MIKIRLFATLRKKLGKDEIKFPREIGKSVFIMYFSTVNVSLFIEFYVNMEGIFY